MTCEMHLGDSLGPHGLAALPDRSVEHVVCDPPFDEHTHESYRTNKKGGAAPTFSFASLTPEQMHEAAAQFARLAQRWVIVFCAAEMIGEWKAALVGAGLRWVRTGWWWKTNPMPQKTGDRPATPGETIAIAHQVGGRMRWHGGGRVARWTFPSVQGSDRVHETQKPVELMEALLREFTDPGDLVVDPYAGSGSTGVACRRLSRRFKGWEVDASYHATAVDRIHEAREQRDLFAPTSPEGEQLGLLGLLGGAQ